MDQPITGGMIICHPESIPIEYGGEQGFTLISDVHLGAPNVDEKRLLKELDTALEFNDRININGDLWDMILVGDRKRYSPMSIHPRLLGRESVINEAIDWASKLLQPYAHLIDMIGVGNHETAVMRHHSMDPTSVLIHNLTSSLPKKYKSHQIHYGGYCGFIDYRLRKPNKGKKIKDGNGFGKRYVIFYHHGSGGSAPVTKGMIDFNRKDTWVDADCIWLGHKHNRFNAAVEKISCPKEGFGPIVKDVRHIMTGAYFNTYIGQTQESIRKFGRRSNYAADSGMSPQGKGGARIVLSFPGQREMEVKVIQ